jgi:hypothetical protein
MGQTETHNLVLARHHTPLYVLGRNVCNEKNLSLLFVFLNEFRFRPNLIQIMFNENGNYVEKCMKEEVQFLFFAQSLSKDE